MKRKVLIALTAAIISTSASVSAAQTKTPFPSSQPSKPVTALSEEKVKDLIQSETEKKDVLRGQAETERKFDITMVWVQVLLGGVSLLLAFLAVVPLLLGVLFWLFRKNILGQLNTEAKEEVSRQVEEHLRPTIDTEVQAQISALIEKKLNQRMQEFEAAVPASNQETPSPEKLSQIDELRRRFEDLQDLLQDLLPTMMMPSAEYYCKQGNVLYFEKQYEQAIDSYDKALECKSDYSEAWNNRGVALDKLKRYEEAITAYDKALEFKSDDPSIWKNRGITLSYLKRYEEAISSHDKALEFKSDDPGIWTNRGITLGYLKRYEEAISSHDKAIELKPNASNVWYNRACSYALQGNVDATVHDLAKAIKLDSTCRETARTDSDFDKVRHDERFQKLLNEDL
jgi:tetratricopeptide (TPR) repeat protein